MRDSSKLGGLQDPHSFLMILAKNRLVPSSRPRAKFKSAINIFPLPRKEHAQHETSQITRTDTFADREYNVFITPIPHTKWKPLHKMFSSS
jgi:hypothetical protein